MYRISINGGEAFEVQLAPDGNGLVNGKEFRLDIAATGPGTYHIIKDNQSWRVELVKLDREEKRVVFRINGMRCEANLKDRFDTLVESMGLSANAAGKVKDFRAPMPGLVLDIFAREGEMLGKGDQLMVLEAMKMENLLKCPGDGVVRKILVSKGQAVEKNQVLISFE